MKNLFLLVFVLSVETQGTDLKLHDTLKPLEKTSRAIAPVPEHLMPPRGYMTWPNGGGIKMPQ